jgi:hypothetical protein
MVATGSVKRPFQFSIRGLLLTTAVISVGLSIGCLKGARFEDGLFAAATAWIVIGLVNQLLDLAAAFRQTADLSPDQRFGWWFAMLWRGVLVMMLVGHFVLIELLATGSIALFSAADAPLLLGYTGHDALRNAIFALSLFFVFAGLDDKTSPSPPRRINAVLRLVKALAVVVLVALLVFERVFIFRLVDITCAVMAMAMKRVAPDAVRNYSEARARLFFDYALLAAGFVLLDLVLLAKVIACWNARIWPRVATVGALVTCLSLTGIAPIWLVTRGFRGISPLFADVYQIAPLNRWVLAMLLVILLVTWAARRMILTARMPQRDTRWNWRRRPSTYYHENRLVALLVAATMLCQLIRPTSDGFGGFRLYDPSSKSINFVWMAPDAWLADSCVQLWLVVFALAIYRAIFGSAGNTEGLDAAPLELPLPLFTVVWAALLIIVIMAVPILTALGYGISLNWWQLRF